MSARSEEAEAIVPCAPCVAAWGQEVAECVCPPHTESQIRLGRKIALVFQGTDRDEETGWFMDDAAAVDEPEGDGWVVDERPSWHDYPVIAIQGALYTCDINAEGHAEIEPFEPFRQQHEEDVAWVGGEQ